MSEFQKAALVMSEAEDPERGLAAFSAHVNLNTVLGLLRHHFDIDDIEGLDRDLEQLQTLIPRHRYAHRVEIGDRQA